jgi:hypothetical protein
MEEGTLIVTSNRDKWGMVENRLEVEIKDHNTYLSK